MARPRLTRWQRFKRWLSLLGGSYTWPDGYIELDFEQAAGIEPEDDTDTQLEKLGRHHANLRRPVDGIHGMGGILIGAASFVIASDLGVPHWHAAICAMMLAIGLPMAITGRLRAW